jgi:hypothetical protein
MVECGHTDGVAPDEWVAYEYAKVRWFYDMRMRLPERTTIEFSMARTRSTEKVLSNFCTSSCASRSDSGGY